MCTLLLMTPAFGHVFCQLPIQALFANWQDLYEEVDAVQIFGSPRHVANHPRMQTTVDRLMLQQMLL